MDAAIADTINRQDAQKVAAFLDRFGVEFDGPNSWYYGVEASALMSTHLTSGEMAWLFARLAAGVPDLHFDGNPADADWDNMFTHFRAEIQARRDRAPKTPPAPAAKTQLGCVV
jgi:hypothetical protein